MALNYNHSLTRINKKIDKKYHDLLVLILQLIGEACSSVLGIDVIEAIRLNMLEIPPEDLDLIVLSHLQQNRVNSDYNKKTSSHT